MFLKLGVNLGLTVLLHELLHVAEELAYAVALILVFSMNFLLSRHVVFSSASGNSVRQAVLFGISTLLFRSLEYLLFLFFHAALGLWYVGVIIGVSLPMMLIKFVILGKFVFVAEAPPGHEPS